MVSKQSCAQMMDDSLSSGAHPLSLPLNRMVCVCVFCLVGGGGVGVEDGLVEWHDY